MCPLTLVRSSILLALLASLPSFTMAQDTPGFLTSRPLAAPKIAAPLKVGEEIATTAGQRRRVVLDSGVTVFLNQNSKLKYAAKDEVNLSEGEAFIDVRGRRPDPAKASPLFTVKSARGTSEGRDAGWVVRTSVEQPGVAVIRGTVNVAPAEGKPQSVVAGSQLILGKEAAPMVRASHVLDWARDLMLASESPLVPGSEFAGGALIVKDPQGQEAKLEMRRFHVDVYIEDGFARTTIDQTYFNHEQAQLEGTFFFPLPPDASLSRLAMYVDGVLQEGGIVERDRAQRIYDEFRYMNRDPALLEWVDGSTFKMRVFPIEGRREKRLILSYSQKLPVMNADMTYRFPAGHSLQTVRAWSFQAFVKGGDKFSWASPSHPLKSRAEDGDLILTGSAKNARTDRDVVVSFTDKTLLEKNAGARFSMTTFGDARYFMVRYQPPLASEPKPQRRDWVFLFEASGDRNPLLARAQIEVIRNLLVHAEADDTFNVLTANTRVRTWAKGPQPVTSENIAAAVAFLEGTHLIGALDLGQALGEADKLLQETKDPHLVHLGSGVPAMGERREDVLAKRLSAKTCYVGIGVGRRWNRSLMKSAAEQSGGLFTQINPDEPISWRAFDLLATLNTPRLHNIEATGGKTGFLLMGQTMAQGEEICAIARLEKNEPLPEALKITGRLNGWGWDKTVPVKVQEERADYLPRTWAKLEIDRLLSEDAVKHRDSIVALSKTMYVMTPYTSLLVLENEDQYTQYKVDRGRKDHWAMYPCPEKIAVVYEPIDGEADPKTLGKKMTVKQVLKTIVTGERKATDGLVSDFTMGLRPEAREEPVPQELFMARSKSDREEIFQFSLGMFRGGEEGLTLNLPASLAGAGVVTQNIHKGLSASVTDALLSRQPPPPPASVAFPGDYGSPRTLHGNGAPDGLPSSQHIQFAPVFAAALPGAFLDLAASRPVGINITFKMQRMADVPVVELESLIRGPKKGKAAVSNGYQYGRPSFSLDTAFFDLVSYAPGMSTNLADICAVLEAEAQPLSSAKLGQIDPAARALLQKARGAGRQSWTLAGDNGQTGYTIHFDQLGNVHFERTLPFGVREKVMSDGQTLMYLYPQLGLAARRSVSRFHRAQLAELIPWLTPTPEDLAHGADVKMLDDNTIAVIPTPRGRGTPSPAGQSAPTPTPKPEPQKTTTHLHLIFTPEGALAERQLIKMSTKEILYRLICSPDGTVKLMDAKGKELAVRQGKLTPSQTPPPALEKETKNLLVLSLPYRTPEHTRKALKIEKKGIGELRFQEALPLFAAEIAAGNQNEAGNIFRQVFHAREQRQLGFYVLLASCGHNLDSQNLDVLAEHLDEPIAQYLALHTSPVLRKHASQWAVASENWPDGFLKDLAVTHAILQRWQSDKVLQGDPVKAKAEQRRAIDHVRRHKDSAFGWTLLSLMQDRADKALETAKDAELQRVQSFEAELAECWELFKDKPDLNYAARYEAARSFYQGGQKAQARKRFQDLYGDAVKEDVLPAIESHFRLALEDRDNDPWSTLMTATAAKWAKEKHRPAVLALARQCWWLGDLPLAQHLLGLALQGVTDEKERLPLTLAGIGLLREMGQVPEADNLVQKLLGESAFAQRADLWRLASNLAEKRDMKARALECLEKAMDLEFRKLPDVIDMKSVRDEYSGILSDYENMAEAMAALKIALPAGFLTKVVKTADRWRSLDPDSDDPCKLAAKILTRLGDRDLSWDYLTTPIALHPGEASAWTTVATSLSQRGDLRLADRAFKAACEAEPANAQLLWDRAQNLRQAGDVPAAQRLLRELADGAWHARFQGLRTQAKLQLNAN